MVRNTHVSLGFVMSDTSLGAELKKRRGKRSISEISRDCGVSVANLSRIEANIIETPSRDTLAAISRGYNMPLEMLAQLVYCGSPATDQATPPSMKEPALAAH